MSNFSNLHIYTAPRQPATRYLVDFGSAGRHFIRNKPRALARCRKCQKLRRCENLVVQAYYDCTYYWCAPGKGCKVNGRSQSPKARAKIGRKRSLPHVK